LMAACAIPMVIQTSPDINEESRAMHLHVYSASHGCIPVRPPFPQSST
jgi:hypothetical protein